MVFSNFGFEFIFHQWVCNEKYRQFYRSSDEILDQVLRVTFMSAAFIIIEESKRQSSLSDIRKSRWFFRLLQWWRTFSQTMTNAFFSMCIGIWSNNATATISTDTIQKKSSKNKVKCVFPIHYSVRCTMFFVLDLLAHKKWMVGSIQLTSFIIRCKGNSLRDT